MKYYDSLVVFSHPEKLPYIDKLVYGIGFNIGDSDQDETSSNLHEYIKYLSAIQKWAFVDGGSVDGNIWTDKEGNQRKYTIDDDVLKSYVENAFAATPIDYMVLYNCKTSFLNDETDGDFITKNIRALWKRGIC